MATTAATTGQSFAQMRKQRKIQASAEAKAAEVLAEARKKLDMNYYRQLAIQKEPYELEREALISAGAQSIAAGAESERGAAATAGRIQMAQQQGQRDIATAMGQEMLGLDKLVAQEQSRLRDVGAQIDLAEAEGAQLAAAQAQEAAGVAQQQAFEGATSMIQQGFEMAPLYFKNLSEEQKAMYNLEGEFDGKLYSEIAGMSLSDYRKYRRGLGREGRKNLFYEMNRAAPIYETLNPLNN